MQNINRTIDTQNVGCILITLHQSFRQHYKVIKLRSKLIKSGIVNAKFDTGFHRKSLIQFFRGRDVASRILKKFVPPNKISVRLSRYNPEMEKVSCNAEDYDRSFSRRMHIQ